MRGSPIQRRLPTQVKSNSKYPLIYLTANHDPRYEWTYYLISNAVLPMPDASVVLLHTPTTYNHWSIYPGKKSLWWNDNDMSMEYLPAAKYRGKVWLIVGTISKAKSTFLTVTYNVYYWYYSNIYILSLKYSILVKYLHNVRFSLKKTILSMHFLFILPLMHISYCLFGM